MWITGGTTVGPRLALTPVTVDLLADRLVLIPSIHTAATQRYIAVNAVRHGSRRIHVHYRLVTTRSTSDNRRGLFPSDLPV